MHPKVRRRSEVVVLGWAVGLTVGLTGCGMTPFSPHRLDSTPYEISRLVGRIGGAKRAPSNVTGRPMVFMVATRPRGIVAVDLESGQVRWRQDISDSSSRIAVGRRNIYYRRKADILEARSVRTGKLAWRKKLDLGAGSEIYGIAADGDRLYYVAGVAGEALKQAKWRSRLVAVDGADGDIEWTRWAPGRIGAPAARGGYVFVPYRQQYLSVLDSGKGKEVLRVRARQEYITFARATSEGIFFGGKNGVFRLNRKAASGVPEKADYLKLKLALTRKAAYTGLFGGQTKGPKGRSEAGLRVAYYWDGYEPVMCGYTAYDLNRLLWRGESGKRFAHDRAVLQYFRYFFGFNTDAGELAWVHVHPHVDVRSAFHLKDSVIYLARDGELVLLDGKTGDRLWSHHTKIRIRGATFDAEGFNPQGTRIAARSIVDGLKSIVYDPDRRLTVAKFFAISQLTGLKGRTVSKILLDLISHRKTSLPLRRRAEQVLVQRASRESVPLLLKALDARYDYALGTRPRVVGPVAMALASMKEQKAVTPLTHHLTDPHTPPSTLLKVVTAMARIGGKGILKPFRQFLLDYRADSSFVRHLDVLTRAAQALLDHGGVAERQLLAFVAEDRHSLPQLREFVRRALGKKTAGK